MRLTAVTTMAVAAAAAGWLVRAEPTATKDPPAISMAEAERLAAIEGDVHVPGRTLDVEAARRLAEHDRGRLIFDDLTDLPPPVAEALAVHTGGLVFTRLAALSPPAARELALEGRGELRLPALVAPPPQTLHELAAFDGPLLLDGVRSLPADVAERLKERQRKTSLRGVTRIGDKATTWRAWAGPTATAAKSRDDGSDADGEDDDPEEDDDPGEKSRRGRAGRGGDADEDDTDGNDDDPEDDSGVIGADG
jgi:hypothetical protein